MELDAPKTQNKNGSSENVTYKGRKAVRVTDQGDSALPGGCRLALLPGITLAYGVIEVDIAGDTKSNVGPAYRGFCGIAFHVTGDGSKYDAFCLHPKNGRSLDQSQRNHSAQYISIPDWPWRKLREQFPAKYEVYVDLVPGE